MKTLRTSRATVNGMMPTYAKMVLIRQRHADLFAAYGKLRLTTAFLSDSIIITATANPPTS
jgi:hypothetical protein